MRKLLALLALCVFVSPSFAEESLKEVKWGHIASTAFYWDVYAARELGFMKEQKLDVQAIRIDSASQSIPQVLTGGVDILSSNPELAISAIKKGGDLVIIGDETASRPLGADEPPGNQVDWGPEGQGRRRHAAQGSLDQHGATASQARGPGVERL